jgi:hypothetical protein
VSRKLLRRWWSRARRTSGTPFLSQACDLVLFEILGIS